MDLASKQPVKRPQVQCPHCGTDVMVTGWTRTWVVTATYMHFDGRGAAQIANTERELEKAECVCCHTELAQTPAELMRAA